MVGVGQACPTPLWGPSRWEGPQGCRGRTGCRGQAGEGGEGQAAPGILTLFPKAEGVTQAKSRLCVGLMALSVSGGATLLLSGDWCEVRGASSYMLHRGAAQRASWRRKHLNRP